MLQHMLCLAKPALQKGTPMLAKPGLPCDGSYIYPCWRREGRRVSDTIGLGRIQLSLPAFFGAYSYRAQVRSDSKF
jgi:hypothetical protein